MKHRPRPPEQDDLLRPRLVDMIEPRHELVKLSALIDWGVFDREWAGFFPSGKGRPATPTRLVAGLLYLQHAYRLSDEAVVARWIENPYHQHFTGETFFQHRPPIDPSSLTRWRGRIGEEGVEWLLTQTIRAGRKSGAIDEDSVKRVAVDTTHDYKRHGTTTLFAALDVKSGLVIGECMPRHRAKEFLTFLRRIDRAVKKPRDIYIVLDNYATHKTPEVLAWLEKHPRFKLHFTPTSASWLNLVERFFAEITERRIRRGSYSSADDLEGAIYDYLMQHNAKPKPFVWSKTAEDIIARERRALDALDQIRGNR